MITTMPGFLYSYLNCLIFQISKSPFSSFVVPTIIDMIFSRSSIDQSQVLLVRYRSCPCSTRIKGHWSNQDFVDIAFYQSYLLDKIFDLNRDSRYLSLMRSVCCYRPFFDFLFTKNSPSLQETYPTISIMYLSISNFLVSIIYTVVLIGIIFF